ncbi:hypothetical protein Q4520_21205 [Alteromonas sp. 1_MG-2023]|uniref:hypothetical protein n=1 Tax=Alteromonas sp. 1_MG-2023 TaxID=3062669 RepID=UPI0026E1421F|nr:hypothetical protein [Alteromonas sp. 1_MG-2023]MDO6477942.1 hypothetical protein [Alteromonas sp. 1_MG-2023]
MSKQDALLNLAKLRQETRYDGYTAIGDYDEGVWECDYVSPYSLSSHNEDSDILVILQDWCSSESFDYPVCEETLKLGHTPGVRTNINLKALLDKYFGKSLEDIYSTNLFPFVKPGAMNAPIATKALVKAAEQFTLPLIKIINPKIAICLGKNSFNALRRVNGLPSVANMEEAINSTFKYENTLIFCQAHTGQLGLNNRNRGGVDRVSADWERMRSAYEFA